MDGSIDLSGLVSIITECPSDPVVQDIAQSWCELFEQDIQSYEEWAGPCPLNWLETSYLRTIFPIDGYLNPRIKKTAERSEAIPDSGDEAILPTPFIPCPGWELGGIRDR